MPSSDSLLQLSAAILSASGLAIGAAAYAMLYPQSQLCGPVLIAPPQPQQIALTFDDGPNPAATPQLLEALAAHNIRATFFLIGAHVLREPALTRAIAAAGHIIGNHTMNHPWLHLLPESRIRTEISDCNRALEDTLGRRVRLFRPPHGARRPAVLRIAREHNLDTVNWNIIVKDWLPTTPEVLLARMEKGILRNRTQGHASNIVLHDGGHAQPRLPTVEAVTQLLNRHQGATYTTPEAWLA
ncbi:polysaccharide deacetylase family protein [Granulicella tundricola]|uniref:Polysaccharide deacetylase n=1 Tax=Granulicella tundricola (strain ATCC BAA-1859 / DSM 23138 / MP5ACTX9) TaxID=1198114 RepID=E8WW00_GRATM|nr:polysaccharide deacetylase family protein [Granulicella tundricola]ADW67306.1 polysaccharide deacetylase [Granulicella tundricola MP5ACTX9]